MPEAPVSDVLAPRRVGQCSPVATHVTGRAYHVAESALDVRINRVGQSPAQIRREKRWVVGPTDCLFQKIDKPIPARRNTLKIPIDAVLGVNRPGRLLRVVPWLPEKRHLRQSWFSF